MLLKNYYEFKKLICMNDYGKTEDSQKNRWISLGDIEISTSYYMSSQENYRKIGKVFFTHNTNSDVKYSILNNARSNAGFILNVDSLKGNLGSVNPFVLNSNSTGASYYQSTIQLAIGDGEEEVNYEDWTLSSQIPVSKYKILGSSIDKYIDKENGVVKTTFNQVFNVLDAFTIKEIALAGVIYYSSIVNDNSWYSPMIFTRDLLEEPVTVESGETFTLSITLEEPY